MMNRKLILMMAIAVFLVACTRSPGTPAKNAMAPPPGPNPAGCEIHKLKLFLKTNSIKLTPKNRKCMVPGRTYTIDIKIPDKDVTVVKGDVTTKLKTTDATYSASKTHWLDSSNYANKDEVPIKVPGDAPADTDFSYDIMIKGHGMLDPKVKVVGEAQYSLAVTWSRKHYKVEQLDLLMANP